MKAPAVQIFMADFFMDTVEWSVDEVGIYWRLLEAQWVNGDLPDNITRLSRIAGCSPQKLQKAWGQIAIKFSQNGEGRLQNLRLEETREEQRKYRELQREKGIEGAKVRWGDDSHGHNRSHNYPNGRTVALQSSSLKKEKNIKKRKEKMEMVEQSLSEDISGKGVLHFTTEEQEKLNKRFSREQLEWMFNKLDFHLSTTKKKYSGVYGFFKKGSWLIEEMEKHFNISGLQPGIQPDNTAVEEAREDVKKVDMDKTKARLNELAQGATKTL